MDILTRLNNQSSYSTPVLQAAVSAWVLSGLVERPHRRKVKVDDGDVSEDDYTKQSLYSLLYSVYRIMGQVESDDGSPFELTFNTWGYDWPEGFGEHPVDPEDPQRFGRMAYTGLYDFPALREYIDAHDGKVHIVEMGCGTGAGAHHVCSNVLPRCTYEAIDMQAAGIATANRLFVPDLPGRLRATHADATKVNIPNECANIVAVCETHVTEYTGRVTDEDERFFATALRMLKPGGFLTWGNAIPDPTWEPAFDLLERLGFEKIEVRDVTREAVRARDLDAGRVHAFVSAALDRFVGFRIPFAGNRRRKEAEMGLKNFYRDPGTNLYRNMVDGTDTYKVVLFRKPLEA